MSSVSALAIRLRNSIPWRNISVVRGQATALACIAGATLLRWPLAPFTADLVPFITYFPAVLVAAVWGGTRAGVSALALSLVVAGFSWVTPDGDLRLRVLSWSSMVAFAFFGGLLVLVSDLLRAALKDLANSNERSRLLAEEMKHRVKNMLSMAAAISRQSARGASSVGEYQALMEGRLNALATAQDLGTLHPLSPTELRPLLLSVLKPFDDGRLSISGPPVEISQSVTPMLAIVVHELATNATKYGAWSVPGGAVEITWRRIQGFLELAWIETGGPPVSEPTQAGFGSRLMRSVFQGEDGSVDVQFRSEGVRCIVSFRAEGRELSESAGLEARFSEA